MSSPTGTVLQAVRLSGATGHTAGEVCTSKSLPGNTARSEHRTASCLEVES